MHNTCSKFGPVQPESTVAVWSTSTKPAMCRKGGQHGSAFQAGASPAGAPVVIPEPPPGLGEDPWELEQPIQVVSRHVVLVSHGAQILNVPENGRDIFTGELIPDDRIMYICQECDRTQRLIQEGKAIFTQVWRQTPGSSLRRLKAAKQASAEHVGGTSTQLWDRLCGEKIVISICVTAPPADTKDQAAANERRLLMVIHQCDQTLQGLCQDKWTSTKEIGKDKESFIYLRYPYHMGETLQKLCRVLNTISVQNHKFSACVVKEGKAKLHHYDGGVKPWEPSINGHSLQPLGEGGLRVEYKKPPAKCEESFMKGLSGAFLLNVRKSIDGGAHSAAPGISEQDWCQIQLHNNTWRHAHQLSLNDDMETARVYFIISGLVIDAANNDSDQGSGNVFFYTCTTAADYGHEQEHFMGTRAGDTILALDAPFTLTFDVAPAGSHLDAKGGILAVFGLKYEVDEDKGIVFKQAGIIMKQHVSSNTHRNQLHIFNGQMSSRLAEFMAMMAANDSGTIGGPA